jgi:outer membrane immunogenic protein
VRHAPSRPASRSNSDGGSDEAPAAFSFAGRQGSGSCLAYVAWSVASSVASSVPWSSVGRAADVGVPPPPPPPFASTWTGCYIGGHGGYGTASSSSVYSSPISPILDVNGFFTAGQLIQSFDNKGTVGGGQLGCQQQWGAFVWGIEGDWSSFRNSSSRSFANGFDEGGGVNFSQTFIQTLGYSSLWSARGRVGMVFSEVYHVYLTAGVGGARTNYTYSASFNETGVGSGAVGGAVDIRPSRLVYGAGMEWKAWSGLIVGVEYLHYDLTSDTVIPFNTALLNPSIALGDHVRTTNIDAVRARVSWLIGFGR